MIRATIDRFWFLQLGLKWNPDGFWGEGTEKAVKKLRQDNNLKGMNVVDEEVYKLLGF